jgi:hypothetical protein
MWKWKNGSLTVVAFVTGSKSVSGFNQLAYLVLKIKIPIVSYIKDDTLTVVAAVLAASVTPGSRYGSGF